MIIIVLVIYTYIYINYSGDHYFMPIFIYASQWCFCFILQFLPVHSGIFSLLGLQVNCCYREHLGFYYEFPNIIMEGHVFVLSWRPVFLLQSSSITFNWFPKYVIMLGKSVFGLSSNGVFYRDGHIVGAIV